MLRNKKKSLGFSLLEMMVVLAIIILVSALILVQNHQSKRLYKLQKAAHQFAQNVRWAQGMALETRGILGECKAAPTQLGIPEGFGLYVDSANTYFIFFNCRVNPPTYVGSSIIYKTFTLDSGLFFEAAAVGHNVFFRKPNPDCFVDGKHASPADPQCPGRVCSQEFKIQDTSGNSMIVKVNDGCLIQIF